MQYGLHVSVRIRCNPTKTTITRSLSLGEVQSGKVKSPLYILASALYEVGRVTTCEQSPCTV